MLVKTLFLGKTMGTFDHDEYLGPMAWLVEQVIPNRWLSMHFPEMICPNEQIMKKVLNRLEGEGYLITDESKGTIKQFSAKHQDEKKNKVIITQVPVSF